MHAGVVEKYINIPSALYSIQISLLSSEVGKQNRLQQSFVTNKNFHVKIIRVKNYRVVTFFAVSSDPRNFFNVLLTIASAWRVPCV